MKSERQGSRIAYTIRVPLSAVVAPHAVVEKWLKSVNLLPIYLLIPRRNLEGAVTMSAQGITSKLRDTYGALGVVFSVLSEKHNRMLICASSSKEITPSEKEASPSGQPST
jgi:hypothetical protein